MKKKNQIYLRLNLVSIFLIAVSFMSVTLAWFAYSGIANLNTKVDINAWFIELEKDGQKTSNDITISLNDIYPGMKTLTESITINNLGDSDANVFYEIASAKILGEENNYENLSSDYIEDLLSHDYPFSIDMSLTKNYVLSKGESTVFEISISWPLDSGTNELDSLWGNRAYNYQTNELEKLKKNPNYQVEQSIQIRINLTAEQYLADNESSDFDYNLGDEILVDVINNKRCTSVSDTCLLTYVLDTNNTIGDDKVTLLINPLRSSISSSFYDYVNSYNSYVNNWKVYTRPLKVDDILKVASIDVASSFLIRNELSDALIGNLKYKDRMNTELNKAISGNGYYIMDHGRFSYLASSNCYWTESNYNDQHGFAVVKENDNTSKIYNNKKENHCSIIPIIEMYKNNLG